MKVFAMILSPQQNKALTECAKLLRMSLGGMRRVIFDLGHNGKREDRATCEAEVKTEDGVTCNVQWKEEIRT